MITTIHATNHGTERARERAGVPESALDRVLDRVLQRGIQCKDTVGRLRKYMDWLQLEYRRGNGNRIYGNQVYIIHDGRLITVLPLPPQYRAAVAKASRQASESEPSHA